MEGYIFEHYAEDVTQREAADTFAAGYWDEPRVVGDLWNSAGRVFFRILNGVRTYELVYVEPTPYRRHGLYAVRVVKEGEVT